MKLEEGLVIIRKDRTKVLKKEDWTDDYLFFDKDECLKYFYKTHSTIKNFGIDSNKWSEDWVVIEREPIGDIIEKIKLAMYSKKQETVYINIKDIERILKEIENVTK